MNIDLVPITELTHHPDNPRLGDVDAIKESIVVNGWHGTIVAQRGTRYILAGNHRHEAAQELVHGQHSLACPEQPHDHNDLTALPTYWVDCDEATALRILAADNRTADLATYDDPKLLRLTARIADPEAAMQVIMDPEAKPEDVFEAIRAINAAAKPDRLKGSGYSAESVQQISMALGGGEAKEWGSEGNVDVLRDRYENTEIRQIVLVMNVEEYERVVPVFKQILDANNFETFADVIFWLLEKYGPRLEATDAKP